jgi:hypothetical protein
MPARPPGAGRENCNDYSVGIELEGLEGGLFEPAQYAAGRLLRGAGAHYPIDAITGHEHIAPGRKHDPGPGFDWQRLRRLLGWPAARFAEGALTGNPRPAPRPAWRAPTGATNHAPCRRKSRPARAPPSRAIAARVQPDAAAQVARHAGVTRHDSRGQSAIHYP